MLEGKLRISPVSFEDDETPVEPEAPETEEEGEEGEKIADDDLVEDDEGWDEDGRE